MADIEYILGHGEREIRRLELQASILEPGTDRVLRSVGLKPGMRVLDVGTGAGDVAMLAARMVGASGDVLGIDRDESVLARARARAEDAGLTRIRYRTATLDALPAAEPFDLVVGRYVLCHQADPVVFLRQAARLVGPGGTLAILEPGIPDADRGWSNPAVPLYDTALGLILTAFGSVGTRISIGTDLVRLFHEAALPEPDLIQDVPVGGPASPIIEWMTLTLHSLLPRLEAIGATSAAEIGIETLRARVQAAVSAAHSQLRAGNLVGGWVRIG